MHNGALGQYKCCIDADERQESVVANSLGYVSVAHGMDKTLHAAAWTAESGKPMEQTRGKELILHGVEPAEYQYDRHEGGCQYGQPQFQETTVLDLL